MNSLEYRSFSFFPLFSPGFPFYSAFKLSFFFHTIHGDNKLIIRDTFLSMVESEVEIINEHAIIIYWKEK